MTIQEILKIANFPTGSDNRSRTVRQINKLFKETEIEVTIVPKGFMRTTKKGFDWTIKIIGFGKVTRFYTKQNYIEPIDILTKIGKFLQREDVRELVNASVQLPCECGKCNSTGILPQFMYYADGVCFDCMGSGFISFETSVEINKKLSPYQKAYKYLLNYVKGERKNFDGLIPLYCYYQKELENGQYWLLEDETNFYMGQPKCQNNVDFIIPKSEFEEFKVNYNKSRFSKTRGILKT